MSPACPVFGFLLHLRPLPGIEPQAFARQLSEFLATKALVASGELPTLLISGDGMQATDADRESVSQWLTERSDIAHVDVGPLGDVGGSA